MSDCQKPSYRPLRSACSPSVSGLRGTHPRAEASSVGFAREISPVGATRAMRLRSFTASRISLYGSMGTSRVHTTRPNGISAPTRGTARDDRRDAVDQWQRDACSLVEYHADASQVVRMHCRCSVSSWVVRESPGRQAAPFHICQVAGAHLRARRSGYRQRTLATAKQIR